VVGMRQAGACASASGRCAEGTDVAPEQDYELRLANEMETIQAKYNQDRAACQMKFADVTDQELSKATDDVTKHMRAEEYTIAE
jgi:hypothetical protein